MAFRAVTLRRGLGVVAAAAAAAVTLLASGAGSAAAAGGPPCFAQIPPAGGIPPWGFHTGDPLTGDTTISGKICQVVFGRHHRERLIVMRPLSPIISHTHVGRMWGYPGNLIVVHVKVTRSLDPACRVGTIGRMTMFASYNGVRSDSVRYRFPAACADQDHLYHGPQVNAQVPPL
jgi:hypothetical protein